MALRTIEAWASALLALTTVTTSAPLAAASSNACNCPCARKVRVHLQQPLGAHVLHGLGQNAEASPGGIVRHRPDPVRRNPQRAQAFQHRSLSRFITHHDDVTWRVPRLNQGRDLAEGIGLYMATVTRRDDDAQRSHTLASRGRIGPFGGSPQRRKRRLGPPVPRHAGRRGLGGLGQRGKSPGILQDVEDAGGQRRRRRFWTNQAIDPHHRRINQTGHAVDHGRRSVSVGFRHNEPPPFPDGRHGDHVGLGHQGLFLHLRDAAKEPDGLVQPQRSDHAHQTLRIGAVPLSRDPQPCRRASIADLPERSDDVVHPLGAFQPPHKNDRWNIRLRGDRRHHRGMVYPHGHDGNLGRQEPQRDEISPAAVGDGDDRGPAIHPQPPWFEQIPDETERPPTFGKPDLASHLIEVRDERLPHVPGGEEREGVDLVEHDVAAAAEPRPVHSSGMPVHGRRVPASEDLYAVEHGFVSGAGEAAGQQGDVMALPDPPPRHLVREDFSPAR